MPTYDYACPKCDTTIEVFHSMSERPKVLCPRCKTRTRKQIGAGAGVLFKGSGFYQTDYRSGTYHAAAKADSSASTASTSTASTSTAPSTPAPPKSPSKD